MRKLVLVFLIAFFGLSCNIPSGLIGSSQTRGSTSSVSSAQPAATTPAIAPPGIVTATIAPTATPTIPATDTLTLTPSETPTATETPTPAGTPTPQVAMATSIAKTACLYGPNPVYLYMWGLEAGGTARIYGRDYGGNWLWVQPTDTMLYCWIWAPAVTVSVPVKSLAYVNPPLPTNESSGGSCHGCQRQPQRGQRDHPLERRPSCPATGVPD